MNSEGRIMVIEEDRIISTSSDSVPNIGRGHLVLQALDAGGSRGWPEWWPELAPLTVEERIYVVAKKGKAKP